jgi:hypothetical protein
VARAPTTRAPNDGRGSLIGATGEETFANVVEQSIVALGHTNKAWLGAQGDAVCTNVSQGLPAAVIVPDLDSSLQQKVANLDSM